MVALILVALVVLGLVFVLSRGTKNQKQQQTVQLDDALADARRWTERLGSQVLTMSGTDAASTQAIADASDRYTAANSQLASATTVRQAELARESALEGLHYMNAAREIMGMPLGPELPPLEGQRNAGRVSEKRTIEHEGQTITASPSPSPETPNYYPGGQVAGRPVPAGWYSQPWWAGALASGMWTASSVMMFSALFSGMSGVGYSAQAFENGYGEGYAEGLADANADTSDMGDTGDSGDFGDAGDTGDAGGDGFFDGGFFDGDGGGLFDGGGFDF
ncbi:DUF1542 domain-containing protein [Corynebacterium sp. 3HC-13]|nr:DUF1542 domain-containing protein [Corynebacterium poyangense]MBZ8178266.1 DUF1542 domain-containing protein [Corynebacterium poyangense]